MCGRPKCFANRLASVPLPEELVPSIAMIMAYAFSTFAPSAAMWSKNSG